MQSLYTQSYSLYDNPQIDKPYKGGSPYKGHIYFLHFSRCSFIQAGKVSRNPGVETLLDSIQLDMMTPLGLVRFSDV